MEIVGCLLLRDREQVRQSCTGGNIAGVWNLLVLIGQIALSDPQARGDVTTDP
jgi:hypothetical protein